MVQAKTHAHRSPYSVCQSSEKTRPVTSCIMAAGGTVVAGLARVQVSQTVWLAKAERGLKPATTVLNRTTVPARGQTEIRLHVPATVLCTRIAKEDAVHGNRSNTSFETPIRIDQSNLHDACLTRDSG